jgi:hypothetical protein
MVFVRMGVFEVLEEVDGEFLPLAICFVDVAFERHVRGKVVGRVAAVERVPGCWQSGHGGPEEMEAIQNMEGDEAALA